MRGVVLAGGLGSRLLPMAWVTNKHLLPVFDRPMIYFPIQQFVHAGIDDILIVTGGNHAGDFLRLLGNGKEFGLRRLNYAYQEGEGGIAEALGLAEDFADSDPICVILSVSLRSRPTPGATWRSPVATSMTHEPLRSYRACRPLGGASWRSPTSTTTTSNRAPFAIMSSRAGGPTRGRFHRCTTRRSWLRAQGTSPYSACPRSSEPSSRQEVMGT